MHRPRYLPQNPHIDEDRLRGIIEKCTRGFLRVPSAAWTMLAAEASAGTLRADVLLESLVAACSPADTVRRRWVEKTPIHASYLDHVFALFPDAKVVCVVRAPESVMQSAIRAFGVPASVVALDYWRSYRDVHLFLDSHPERQVDIAFIAYERLLNGDEELLVLSRFLGIDGTRPTQLRARAKSLFERLYGETSLRNVQGGMYGSAPVAVPPPAAASLLAAVLRRKLKLDIEPGCCTGNIHGFFAVPALIIDLARGIGHILWWRVIDTIQFMRARLRGKGLTNV